MDNYNEKSIQVLEGLEAVRKRPGMYIGNIDTKGLHHLIWEILDNSIDEVIGKNADKIKVTLHSDDSISIEDNGRGIPIEIHPKTNKSTVETVFTILHAGGKFGGENSGYKVSGGLHGVGASVVNALSNLFEATIFRHGKEYNIKFENGGKLTHKLIEVGETSKKGTLIKFRPDFNIFNDDVNKFDYEVIRNRIKESAFLNKNLEITLVDEANVKEEVFLFENGLVDFLNDLNKNYEVINESVVASEGEKDGISIEVAFQYIDLFQPRIYSYVNNIATIEGGTHVLGFEDAITRVINKYKESKKNFKGFLKYTKEDVKEGMSVIISVRHPDPMYEGQTKAKFSNKEVRKLVNSIISEDIEIFLDENPKDSEKIILKIEKSARSRIASMKARDITRSSSILGNSVLPGKLADCTSNERDKTELFIVEGDSAGGSAKMGRDRYVQAILPLKGKVINAERKRIDQLLINTEISAMISAFGTNIGESFDIEKMRYSKIIIMTDADVDGSHIRTLILTFLFRYFIDLIHKDYVYIAQPPLYKIWKGTDINYVYTENQKDEVFKRLGDNLSKYSIQRYKGLGEMNDEQLWETTMDPTRRKLLLVKIEDAIEAEKTFSNLMGKLVDPRKEFIIKNSKLANLDI